MDFNIPNHIKKVLTMAEGELIPRLQTCVADEDLTEWAMTAARIAGIQGSNVLVLRKSAEVCKNNRVNDYYFDESGQLDIFIQALVFKPNECFAHIGANLSDLQQFSSDRANETKRYILIDKYVQDRSTTV